MNVADILEEAWKAANIPTYTIVWNELLPSRLLEVEVHVSLVTPGDEVEAEILDVEHHEDAIVLNVQ